jgi:acyl-coenzyme A synthetase/AMP-(fatty) acid ligase
VRAHEVVGVASSISRARLAAYKFPEHLFVVDKLPRNAMGKIDRQLLQARAAQLAELME